MTDGIWGAAEAKGARGPCEAAAMAMRRLIGQRYLCSRGIAPTGWIRARGERALGAIGAIGATRCGVDRPGSALFGSGSPSNRRRLSCISGTANYMYSQMLCVCRPGCSPGAIRPPQGLPATDLKSSCTPYLDQLTLQCCACSPEHHVVW